MRVLITGHDGYIGSILWPLVRDAGHEVIGLDSYLFQECAFGQDSGEISAEQIDVRDVEVKHLRGFDAVIHLAAISNDPIGDLNPARTFEVNHMASVRLARLAKRAEVERFIFASSCSLYGAASPDDSLTEAASFNPITPYGESKVLVERDVAEMADDNFSPTFLRCATAYGYSPRLRLDLVVNDLVASAFVTGEIRIKSDGTSWRPLVHVEDLAGAYTAALEAPREAIHNEAFNIGRTQENYQVHDLAEIVMEMVPQSHVTYAEGGLPDKRSYQVNFSKAETSLPGFRPSWTVHKGVDQLAKEYSRFGLELSDLSSPRFIRLQWIQALLHAGELGPDLRWFDGPRQ